MNITIKLITTILVIFSISGCAAQRNKVSLAEHGIIYNVHDEQKIKDSSNTIIANLISYKDRAGLDQNADFTGAGISYQTYLAGSDYINEQCDQYLEALESYSKYYNRAKGMTNNTATLTEVVLAASSASTMAIGITAASFGFVYDSLELFESSVLFELEPSSIRRLVERQISVYEDMILDAQPVNQAELIKDLRGHIKICLPSSIKAAVNDSVKAAVIAPNEEGTAAVVTFTND